MSATPIAETSPRTAQAWRTWLGGFNLLPYRERLARAARRRQAGLYCAAIMLGVLGTGAWVAGSIWVRAGVDAERATLEARQRQLRSRVDEAQRALRIREAGRQRRQQAARFAAPYRPATELLVLLGRVRDDGVRFDALRITPAGAVLDARAVDYPAAARWLARIARERQAWVFDVDALKPAPLLVDAPGSARLALRFSVRVRWEAGSHEAEQRPGHREGRT